MGQSERNNSSHVSKHVKNLKYKDMYYIIAMLDQLKFGEKLLGRCFKSLRIELKSCYHK